MFALLLILYLVLAYFSHESFEQQLLLYTLNYYRSSVIGHQTGTINLIVSVLHDCSVTPNNLFNRTTTACLYLSGANTGICSLWFTNMCLDGKSCTTKIIKNTLSDEFAENIAKELNKTWANKPFLLLLNEIILKLVLLE
ncbi:unnamed protein product [Rotaria sp. Silwood1]|nr:unnamed protein product [Rotaria sp. Silwood1]